MLSHTLRFPLAVALVATVVAVGIIALLALGQSQAGTSLAGGAAARGLSPPAALSPTATLPPPTPTQVPPTQVPPTPKATPPALDIDLTGSWNFSFAGGLSVICTGAIGQSGMGLFLTADCTGGSQLILNGIINPATGSFTLFGTLGFFELDLSGTASADGNTISGVWSTYDGRSGTFTGTRKTGPANPCLGASFGAGLSPPAGKAHDISLDVLRGAGKIRGAQVKRYTAVVKNHNLTGAENIQLCFTVVPLFGCPAPVIDIALPYDVAPGEPDNVFVDVSGDGVPDSVAVAVAPGVLPNRSARIRVTVIYSSCPPAAGLQETPFDYIVQADACHQGDRAPKGFFGSACPGSNDAGQDPNQSNDAPIQKAVNDALR